jgi:F-type H+-transporting ATPase subunit a
MRRLFGFLLVLGFLCFAPNSFAESEGGSKQEEGHWSLAQYFVPVSLVDFIKERFGHSVIEHKEVEDIHHIVFGFLVFLIILVLLAFGMTRLKKKHAEALPEKRFNALALFEVLGDALLGLMEGIMGRENALYFLPFIGALGIFILFSNLLGLIPGFLPPTDTLNTNVAMAICVFFVTHIYGVKRHGLAYFRHFLGPIIKWYALPLMVLMFLIEMISHIARPVSLSVRLLGNIFGDHAVLTAFVAMAIPFVPIPFILLGLLVSFVQALVFCILSTVYISLAIAEEEH